MGVRPRVLHGALGCSGFSLTLRGDGSRGRRVCAIDTINIKRKMNGAVVVGVQHVVRELHDLPDAQLGDRAAIEDMCAYAFQYSLFERVQVSQSYKNDVARVQVLT